MSVDLMGKLMALLCALLWAVAVILFKRAGESIRPAALNLYKTVIAFVLLLPAMWMTGTSLFPSQVTGTDWLAVVVSGILGISLADSLLFKCLNLLGAGLTAIVECLYSPMVMLLSWLVLFDALRAAQLGGALLVVTGVLVATLKTREVSVPAKNIFLGILVGALAMLFMAAGIVLMKPVLQKASVFWVAEVRLLAALVTLLPMVLLDRGRRQMIASLKSRSNWRHAFPATILGNLISMTVWVAAFKFTDASSAAILNQTHTIVIVILASLWLKEPFTLRRLLATIMAFAGSILVLAG